MDRVSRHLTRTFIAGVVALLPVAGLVLTVVVAERSIANSGLADQAWYFPGMGLIAVVLATYLIGLTVSTFIGKFAWRLVDRLIDRLPALGSLYQTMKQVLGYGEGDDAMFQRVVLVPGRNDSAKEIGLVTRELPAEPGGGPRLAIFVPAAPTPTSGRVIVIEESKTQPLDVSVHDALRFLVAVGKVDLASDEETQDDDAPAGD